MKSIACNDLTEFEAAGAGATYHIPNDAILIKCPGCGKEDALPIVDTAAFGDERKWELRTVEPISLAPSVHHSKGCGWHGHLNMGTWREV